MSHSPSRPLASLCLATSMALVGSYVALSKPLTLVLPVFLLGWLRFGIGAVAMASWTRKPPTEAPLSPSVRRLVFLESLLGNFLFSIFMLSGVSMTTVVATGVIMAAIPACVAVLSRIFLKEDISPRVMLSILLAVTGIALFTLTKQQPAGHNSPPLPNQWLGNLLVAGAVVCESAYAVIGKRLSGELSAQRISALINLWGLLLMTPLGLYQALSFDFGAVEAHNWWLLVFYALAASVGTVWLWMTGLKTIPAAQAGVFTVMLPVSATAIGVLFLGEQMSLLQMGAFGIALGGLLLSTLPEPQRTAH